MNAVDSFAAISYPTSVMHAVRTSLVTMMMSMMTAHNGPDLWRA